MRLSRYKTVELALRLPGITLEAIRRAKALLATTRPWLTQPDLTAYDRPRPQLRLVIDNTVPIRDPMTTELLGAWALMSKDNREHVLRCIDLMRRHHF
jgi:hypothetical protein